MFHLIKTLHGQHMVNARIYPDFIYNGHIGIHSSVNTNNTISAHHYSHLELKVRIV